TNVNGTLFFTASNGTTGQELWKSDGTTAGTVLVKDFSWPHYSPENLTEFNGTLYFNVWNSPKDELWKSDGTAVGTMMGKAINPGGHYPNLDIFTKGSGTFYSTANGAGGSLWRSDGTTAGTVPVANLNATSITNANGTVFFTSNDGVHGSELWAFNTLPA